jgi:carbonic anhydrase
MKTACFALLAVLLSAGLALASGAGSGLTPDQALAALKDGNGRFAAGTPQRPHQDLARLKDTAKGQAPFVTILSCSDSREPVELIFDQGFGDLFVIRVAGNVADTDEIGTAEYGVDHLSTPVLLVLGHTRCGAVTAVVNHDHVHGLIPQLVDNIAPAADKARAANPGLAGGDLVEAAVRANVRQSIEDILSRSPSIRDKAMSGAVRIVGAVYDIETGRVEWLKD